MYLISGHTHLYEIMSAAKELGLVEINHIIWKYNFGVFTRRKFVTSHYHILYLKKSEGVHPCFDLYCRRGASQKTEDGNSALYADLEDVWTINREYSPGQIKNSNKLPDELIRKIILYSSAPGDLVCDFFMGNFTTAYVAKRLARQVCGFEKNSIAFDYHMSRLAEVEFGSEHRQRSIIQDIGPRNQGKPFDAETKTRIYQRYDELRTDRNKSQSIMVLCDEFGRGRFSILNLLKKREEAKNGN